MRAPTLLGAGMLLLVAMFPFVGAADVGRAGEQGSNREIVAIDLAGRQTNLTRNPAFDMRLAVSRDGRIVFLSTRDGNPDLYVMNGDGRSVRRVTESAGDDSGVSWNEGLRNTQASWSPRGRRIAFDGLYNAQPATCERLCFNWDVHVV